MAPPAYCGSTGGGGGWDSEGSGASSAGDEASSRGARRLSEALRQIARMRGDRTSWDNEFEKVFSAFRRACISGTDSEILDDPIFDNQHIEAAWLFLLDVRRRHHIRRRQVSECARGLGASSRWSAVLCESPAVRRCLLELRPEVQLELLEAAGAEALVAELGLGPEPPAAQAAFPSGQTQQPWAAAPLGATAPGAAAWPAAPGPPAAQGATPDLVMFQSSAGFSTPMKTQTQKGAVASPWDGPHEQVQEKQNFGDKAVAAGRKVVNMAKTTNETYGISDKIGKGASTAASKVSSGIHSLAAARAAPQRAAAQGQPSPGLAAANSPELRNPFAASPRKPAAPAPAANPFGTPAPVHRNPFGAPLGGAGGTAARVQNPFNVQTARPLKAGPNNPFAARTDFRRAEVPVIASPVQTCGGA